MAELGLTFVMEGLDCCGLTVKVAALLVPGYVFTVTPLVPRAAFAAIVSVAVIVVELTTVMLLTAIPGFEEETVLPNKPLHNTGSVITGSGTVLLLVDDGAAHHQPGPARPVRIVVDEAQELTDAEWQMLLLRCPSRSFAVVGKDQARHGFSESWQERLERIGLDRIGLASLTINYRTPEEVMEEAEPVIRSVLPDANVPTSIWPDEGSPRHLRLTIIYQPGHAEPL